jgi:hydroxyethylthiazole kinase-like uncharacterized protein yjeF
MPGAARLAARTALHGGAGYIELVGDGAGLPDAVVVTNDDGAALADPRLSAILIGPGLGRAGQPRLERALEAACPVILDGDALTLLGADAATALARRAAPTILTPHAGEFERMFGRVQGSKIDATLDAARASGAVILHKGADSVIASPDGQLIVGATASSWLSTAGTGDVLAGLVAARVAAGSAPLHAAAEGLWLHGRAAMLAGPAFAADDLIPQLPKAVAECLIP